MVSEAAAQERALPPEPERPWREELSDRVEDFRRRRARLRGDFDQSANLEFDFRGEGPAEALTETEVDAAVVERPAGEMRLDVELDRPTRPGVEAPVLDSLSLDKPGRAGSVFASTRVDATELRLEPVAVHPRPVEIIIDSQATTQAAEAEAETVALPKASMGRRFLAGGLDTLVLSVAAGLFTLIFWRAGGHMSPQPMNLGVVGFITAFSIMAYFGLFTALTSTTPGLLWLGIEVRTLDGGYPTPAQAFWRAFGYLVSIGALMLGFVWALVDSDGLTWHDRMSGTFLAVADSAVESRESTVEG
jgi:uncharacterized RDD family membrane protein YckC